MVEVLAFLLVLAFLAVCGWMVGYMRGAFAWVGSIAFALLFLPMLFVACTVNENRVNEVSFGGPMIAALAIFVVPLMIGVFLRERRQNNMTREGNG